MEKDLDFYKQAFQVLGIRGVSRAVNKAAAQVTIKPFLNSTLKNYKTGLSNLPTDEIQISFKKDFGIVSEHWKNPQSYFEKIRVKGSLVSDKYKERFDRFLEDAINNTYKFCTDSYQGEELTQKWKEILFFYGYAFKGFKIIEEMTKRKRVGPPLKIHVRIFIKFLNLLLQTLRIDRKKFAGGHKVAIQDFLKGYLNITMDIQTIRQDLYR